MTPEQKLKKEIILIAERFNSIVLDVTIDESNVEEWYQKLVDEDLHWDCKNELRCTGIDTNLPSQFSRNYEAKEVAKQMSDGSWIGWTYWYGGGKFGEPEAIDWMSEAYELKCKEEEKVVIIRTFSKN